MGEDYFGAPEDSIIHKRGAWVAWHKPAFGGVKINTDASIKSQSATGGGVIRNHDGLFVAAFSKKYGQIAIVEAELNAIYDEIQLAKQLGIRDYQVETDSAIALNMIHGDKSRMGLSVYLARRCRKENITQWQHIYREQNKVADALSKEAFRTGDADFYTESQLPSHIQKLITKSLNQKRVYQ